MSAPTTTSTKKELLDVEKQYWDAIKARDSQKLGQLTADRFLMVMEEGIIDASRDEFVGMLTGGDERLTSYSFDDSSFIVRDLAPNVALVAYKAHSDFERQGKPEKMDYFYSTTWVKTNGTWQCAAGAVMPAGQQ